MKTCDCLKRSLALLSVVSVALFGRVAEAQTPPPSPPTVVITENVAPTSPVAFAADLSIPGSLYTDGHGNGGVFADLDNDGVAELYRVAGHRYVENTTTAANQLWKFTLGGGWSLVPGAAGAADVGAAGIGAIAGDYDNDGDLDLYVVNFNEPNVLYRNDLIGIGNGVLSFTDVTADTKFMGTQSGSQLQFGIGLASHNGVFLDGTFTASWLDFDRDGDLDLFVTSLDADNGSSAISHYKPPGHGERSTLYQNMLKEGNSTNGTPQFKDVTMEPNSGGDLRDSAGTPLATAGPSGTRIAAVGVTAGSNINGRHNTPTDYFLGHMGALVADLNNDSWPDIAALGYSRDLSVSLLHLYRNRGVDIGGNWLGFELETFDDIEYDPGPMPGEFTPVPFGSHLASPMGITAGDYDNDGDLDLFSTSTREPKNDLLTNMHDPMATTMAMSFNHQDTFFTAAPAPPASVPPLTSWGAHWLDVNNDGMLDLIVATQENIPPMLFVNEGLDSTGLTRTFVEDATASGLTVSNQKRVGLMIADFNQDGFVDVFLRGMQRNDDQLWKNVSGAPGNGVANTNNWISIKLIGDPNAKSGNTGALYNSTKDAIGARVTAWAILDPANSTVMTKQIREVRSGDSNSTSSSSLDLSFGIGHATTVMIEVEFPSGTIRSFQPPVNQRTTINEATAALRNINCDSVVDNADLNIILNNMGCTSNGRPFCAGDLNFDSVVDDLDVQLWLAGQP